MAKPFMGVIDMGVSGQPFVDLTAAARMAFARD